MTDKATGCECPLAGYCNRHQMQKVGRLHLLCQTSPQYFDRWETQAAGPQISEERELRRQRVIARSKEEKRFRDWCVSMREPSDIGLGDTLYGLLIQCQSRKRSTVKKRIVDFMKVYACVRKTAREQLNERFPYQT